VAEFSQQIEKIKAIVNAGVITRLSSLTMQEKCPLRCLLYPDSYMAAII
jgi:hypothetical protein